ncbi:Dipeptidyl aminopeptidase, partial [Ascosphaera pollenicola]
MADLHAGAVFENVGPFNDQSNLKKVLESTNIPTRVYSKVKVGMGDEAVELNMMEILPPNFDPNKKHPLLVHTYGGPGAAIVDYSFRVEFQDIVSSQLDAVVLIIDPRGTNPDNWKLKS